MTGNPSSSVRNEYSHLPVLPAGWRWVQFSETCDRVSVGHVGPTTEFFTHAPNGICFLRSQNVRPGKLELKNALSVTPDFHKRLKKSQLRAGDILFVRVGANRGDCCVVPSGLGELNCANIVFARPKQPTGFHAYFFQSDLGRNLLLSASVGAAQGVINTSSVANMPVPLPPLHIQQRIADILSAYDVLIENNQRRIRILEDMARSLYREWFVHFRYPGHESVPLVDSPIGPIPTGWKSSVLSSLVSFAKGRKPSETRPELEPGDVKLLLINALQGGQAVFTSPIRLVYAEARDTIMVMDGASSCDVFIGHCGAVGSTLGRFRTAETNLFSPHALFRFLETKSEEFKTKNIGAAIPHANKDFILMQQIALPPVALMASFHNQLEPIQCLIDSLKSTTQNLRRTRDLLLPRLLSGQINLGSATAVEIEQPESHQ